MLFCGSGHSSGWLTGLARTILLLGSVWALQAADFDEALRLYRTGNYTGCTRIAEKIIAEKVRDEEWPILLIRAQLALGRYPEAEATLTNALNRYYASIRLRVLGCEVVSAAGKPGQVPA